MKANSLSVIDLFPMSDSLYPGDVKHIGLKSTISRKIVNVTMYNGCGIKLENLNGLRKLNSKIGDAEKGEKNQHENKKRECKVDFTKLLVHYQSV
jgi:hypothetical protein